MIELIAYWEDDGKFFEIDQTSEPYEDWKLHWEQLYAQLMGWA